MALLSGPRPLAIAGCAMTLSCLSCSTLYVPEKLASEGGFDLRAAGCLDIWVKNHGDPVVEFTIGNRCRYPVGVDFRRLTVRAWTPSGQRFEPKPSDPRDELHEAAVDAHAMATVFLDFPVRYVTPRYCVDLSRLNVDEPASDLLEICFEEENGAWRTIGGPRATR